MYKRISTSLIMSIAVISFVAIGATAWAGWGNGYGMRGGGMGWHHGNGYRDGYQGCAYWGDNLSKEDYQKLDAERQSFIDGTRELRQSLYQKNLELKSELAKTNIDEKKVSSIQNELSNLEAQFDQKRIEHITKMKKINPDVGMGFGGRGMRGYYSNAGPCRR